MGNSLKNQEQDYLMHMLADTFHTDLFLVGDQVRGLVQDYPINVAGIWNIKSDLTIVVDERNTVRVSAVVRVMDHLWAFFIGTKSAANLIFFDSDKAKIKVGAEKEFGLGNAEVTFAKLRPSFTSAFTRSNSGPSESRNWSPLYLTEANIQCLFS